MAIKSISTLNRGKIKIDLTGPYGNAFVLIGCASKLCKTMGKDFSKITEEMQSGDYENLVQVFDREFGHVVDLYR